MASQRDVHKIEVRLKVMLLVAANPDLSTRDVVQEAGISNGSAY